VFGVDSSHLCTRPEGLCSTSIISIVKEQKTSDMNQRAEVRANLESFRPAEAGLLAAPERR